ncbi:MAG: InlB B-repeat-containing protein [Anaerostipes sp.]|nr:InlB B-repeat-containing protein [Anaerostipes sp.]
MRITKNGAIGGGLDINETSLNPEGYWITGTTTKYNILVEENVTTDLTLESVDITCDMAKLSCINVSHADVTITLIGENKLLCNAGESTNTSVGGAALMKEGMDDHVLTIQCEYAEQKNHRCNERCGSLSAKGAADMYHTGAIGSSISHVNDEKNCGFANFKIKGGNIEALAGLHTPGIGSACISQTSKKGYTKNIWITGGNVKAIGTTSGSGIGSGYGNDVDGIYITGGTVEAKGGEYAPGIGASGYSGGVTAGQPARTKNIKISGGDTVVTAIGDKNMPGIGSAMGNSLVSNVTADPEDGYQGYIQDGTSLTDYIFMDGTPFAEETAIKVGSFYTKVYFGPYRDANAIEQNTKEQIGANHVISKTGGSAFTEEQLKNLTKVTGKQPDGTSFPDGQLHLDNQTQLEAVNKAKTAGETGEFPLDYITPNGTKVTVIVYLRDDGTDAVKFDPNNPTSSIGANDFTRETGGDPFTEEELKKIAALKGKNEEGTNIRLDDFSVDEDQMKQINEAKTAGKAGTFELTYTSPDGQSVTVSVSLTGEYDEIVSDAEKGEIIKAMNIISRTGGKGFTEEQVKSLARLKAANADGDPLPGEQLSLKDLNQLEQVNQAKTAGQTGSFPLTFQTRNGSEVTIHVFLTDEGTDGAANDLSDGKPAIGANNISHATGGKDFSQEEIIELCSARGKDKNGDSQKLRADENQLDLINRAKAAGKTGTYELQFSMKDGTKTSVKVTLTGKHKVIFDSDGGDYTPEMQIVEGGDQLICPEAPKRTGYTFEGWYFKDDESGKEVLWKFEDPVHQDMELKAKWKKNSEPVKKKNTENSKPEKAENKKESKSYPDWEYSKRPRNTKTGEAAKTGDKKSVLPFLLMTLGAGSAVYVIRKRKQS